MEISLLLTIGLAYIGIITFFGWKIKQHQKLGKRIRHHSLLYSLSIGVYCSAWTFYGAIGLANREGIMYLAIYIGPLIATGFWLSVIRKACRIKKVFLISNIADFISTRYGKNISLGFIVSLCCFIGIIPYISLQIKSISVSTEILTINQQKLNSNYIGFTYTLICMSVLFILIRKKYDSRQTNWGFVSAIAAESFFKVIFLIITCIYALSIACQKIDTSIFDILNMQGSQAKQGLNYSHSSDWFSLNLLSFMAIFLLPRQFHVMIIENNDEIKIKNAIIIFSIYLFLCSFLIYPLSLVLSSTPFEKIYDDFILLQLVSGNKYVSAVAYLGGISAATSMIIVSTLSLSIMISHNVLIPVFIYTNQIKKKSIIKFKIEKLPVFSYYISIFIVLISAYLFYIGPGNDAYLASLGLLSFSAVAQLAPAAIGALYWKEGKSIAAICSILIGFFLWFVTICIPFILQAEISTSSAYIYWINDRLIEVKKYLSVAEISDITFGTFSSLMINSFVYVFLSLYTKCSSQERNQAELFTDIFKYSRVFESSVAWKGHALSDNLIGILYRFFGASRAQELLNEYSIKYGKSWENSPEADYKLVNFVENNLSSIIGNTSARLLISSVVDEEKITHSEVIELLEQAQKILKDHRELRDLYDKLNKTKTELEIANSKLIENDALKNDFLTTITHELRTPITSIRALSEILISEPDLDQEQRNIFLETIVSESIKISKLIDLILDLEKYESGKQPLNIEEILPAKVILNTIEPFVKSKQAVFVTEGLDQNIIVPADHDKFTQLITNLVSNSIKHNPHKLVKIKFSSTINDEFYVLSIQDDGSGIPDNDIPFIFDKFYQTRNKKSKKSSGSGLGLAICKKIISLHGGKIEARNINPSGVEFRIYLPTSPNNHTLKI